MDEALASKRATVHDVARTAGVSLATVSDRLGHARKSTTLDRYSHWMPQQDQDAADRLDGLFT